MRKVCWKNAAFIIFVVEVAPWTKAHKRAVTKVTVTGILLPDIKDNREI